MKTLKPKRIQIWLLLMLLLIGLTGAWTVRDADNTASSSEFFRLGHVRNLALASGSASVIAPCSNIIINEVDAVTGPPDNNEFIELFSSDPKQPCSPDGLVVVLYDGFTDKSYAAFDLDGFLTNASGFFMLRDTAVAPTPGTTDFVFSNPSDNLQNGADAVALYWDDASSFPNGTRVTTENLVDAIVYGTGQPDDSGLLNVLTPLQPQVNENGRGTAASDSNKRCPDGSGGALNTKTYIQATPTPGASNTLNDADCDGIDAPTDNCPFVYNPDQKDVLPPFGVGDACQTPIVLRDERNGHCVRIDLQTMIYCWKTPTGQWFTGPVDATFHTNAAKQAVVTNFKSAIADTNLFQAGVQKLRNWGSARLTSPRYSRRPAIFGITDLNLADSFCACP